MANLSDLTRKQQVLAYLKARTGLWVDGPELANETVGGSEGLRRLRELRDEDGYNIQTRAHPDPERDISQYRIMPGKKAAQPPVDWDRAEINTSTQDVTLYDRDDNVVATHTYEERVAVQAARPAPRPPVDHVRQRELARKATLPADTSNLPRTRDALRRREDGTFEYVPPQAALIDDQLTIPVDEPVQPPEAKFSRLPAKIDYGTVAICPRCRSKTTRGRAKKKPAEDVSRPTMVVERRRKKTDDGVSGLIDSDGVLLFRDPVSRKAVPCGRCNGYGIVPNQGPIAFTAPDRP